MTCIDDSRKYTELEFIHTVVASPGSQCVGKLACLSLPLLSVSNISEAVDGNELMFAVSGAVSHSTSLVHYNFIDIEMCARHWLGVASLLGERTSPRSTPEWLV